MNEKELVKWFAPSVKAGLTKASDEIDEAETFEDLKIIQHKLGYLIENLESCIKDMEVYDAVRQSIEEDIKKD